MQQAGAMTALDYRALFQAVPTPCAVLDTDLVILDCNTAYRAVVGRARDELVGRGLFEAFPDLTSGGQSADAVRRGLLTAVSTGRRTILGTQRYDIEHAPGPTTGRGGAVPRYWATTAIPLPGPTGEVECLLFNVHDVTALATHVHDLGNAVRRHAPHAGEALEAAAVVAEQTQLFDESLEAERQLGMTVQSIMLPSEIPASVRTTVDVAVRYQPASDALRVGGDWYDVADVGDGRVAVAVGDVVGHGLVAAAVMGQLRSALSALIVADIGPASALAALDRVARHTTEATASTAVKVVIDPGLDLVVYSSAGHPPPLLVRPDGSVQALDQATGPPLAVTEAVEHRPLGTATASKGDTLVLYTDGLVERRGEDIDVGIGRLGEAVSRYRHLCAEGLADALLHDLGDASALRDDVALVVLKL